MRIGSLLFMEESGMKIKLKVKMLIDLLMIMILLLLMAYQVTGEKYHEWLGVSMFLLFVIHNVLNIRWYGNFFKGRYRCLCIMRTFINFAVLTVMPCLTYSRIVMSHYVFADFPINSGMALARVMHLALKNMVLQERPLFRRKQPVRRCGSMA